MKKKTKRRIKRIAILIIAGMVLGIGLMVFNILGPFRGFFWNMPYLSGFLGPKTYLVLLQNNNELRPTGGFITAVAEVNMLFGFPSINVFDSYQVPNPPERLPAPEPFEYFIGQNDPFFAGNTFRDANFSPDFPTSAQELISLYKQAYPDVDIDGVFSLDFSVMEKLLELYGPITVDDTVFTKDNFFILTQRISKDIDTHNVNELNSRKDILKPFTQALKSTILSQPTRYGVLMQTLAEQVAEKHLLAYSSSDSLEEKFKNFGLGGHLENQAIDSDFIHVNIANIGGRKADRYITKDIKYRADFSNPSIQESELEITLEHLGSYNIQSDIYQAYIRIYTPQGTELISSSTGNIRSTVVGSDLNLNMYADYIRMKPGERITLQYVYQLPETILAENYRLKIVKQPGIQNQFWQVALRQPNDSNMQNLLLSQNIEPMTIRENLALWRGQLDTDIQFHVMRQADSDAPVIMWQKFVDLTTINVRFQEMVDATVAENSANYQLFDLNKVNDKKDSIVVTKAEFDERDLWLTVEGVTLQPEEQYQLVLKDIQDLHGNVIEPNPLTRTLVQRIE